jgi:hypothetical protein
VAACGARRQPAAAASSRSLTPVRASSSAARPSRSASRSEPGALAGQGHHARPDRPHHPDRQCRAPHRRPSPTTAPTRLCRLLPAHAAGRREPAVRRHLRRQADLRARRRPGQLGAGGGQALGQLLHRPGLRGRARTERRRRPGGDRRDRQEGGPTGSPSPTPSSQGRVAEGTLIPDNVRSRSPATTARPPTTRSTS